MLVSSHGTHRVGPGLSVALLLSLISLSGCGRDTASVPMATSSPLPTASPTDVVGYVVVVTDVPTARARPTAQPNPTHFAAPAGPWLRISPASGPPVSTTLAVFAGHLAPRSAVSLLWSPGGKVSPLGTTAYSDQRGSVRARLSVPASAPGVYDVVAEVNGVRVASALYHVSSPARLAATVITTSTAETLRVRGRKFQPGDRVLLVAYPMVRGAKPLLIGTIAAGPTGRFELSARPKHLAPGQYDLRAWSQDALSAQLAQTFFEVLS